MEIKIRDEYTLIIERLDEEENFYRLELYYNKEGNALGLGELLRIFQLAEDVERKVVKGKNYYALNAYQKQFNAKSIGDAAHAWVDANLVALDELMKIQ